MNWLETILLILGGGVGVRIIDWIMLRESNVWAHVKRITERVAILEGKLEVKDFENDKLERENGVLRNRCSELELRVADLEKQLGLTHIVIPSDPHAESE